MKLVDVYTVPDATDVLWALLSEREPHENISHKKMPTPQQHSAFIASKPYEAWYLIDAGEYAGAVYLTRQREVGVGVLKRHRGNKYGSNAVCQLMQRHPGDFLANINPENKKSLHMFSMMGFQLAQYTYTYAQERRIVTKQHTGLVEGRPLHQGRYICMVCGVEGALNRFQVGDCLETGQSETSGWEPK